MLPGEAALSVTLRLDGGHVGAVDIRSTRLVNAARLLAGRAAADAPPLLSTIFALCGTAQGIAGASAIETAAGLVASPAQRMARRCLLLVETAAEHALGIARDWPALMGEQPDLEAARALRPVLAGFRRGLYPDGDWHRPGGGRLSVDREALADHLHRLNAAVATLVGATPESVLGWLPVFEGWMRDGGSAAARLLQRVEDDGLAGFGRSTVPPMAPGGPRDLAERLAADHDGSFAARPDGDGRVFETGPLSRHGSQPVVAQLVERHGNGLLPRFAARLAELFSALRELTEMMQDLADDPAPPCAVGATGSGLGRADAARGLLVHRVELEEGRVRRYQVLAPTEWNFHPYGPLAWGLRGAEASPDLEWRARLLANALDPCVACTITVE